MLTKLVHLMKNGAKLFVPPGFFLTLLLGLTACDSETSAKISVQSFLESSEDVELVVGTGSEAGAYHAFGEKLIKLSTEKLSIQLKNTRGSVDNLNQIKNQTLDAAIVQNDVAYKTYKGNNGSQNKSYRSGLPLFNEYIFLVVNKDSNIYDLSDLKGDVWVGKLDSGTRVNAVKIIDEAGLRPFVKMPAHMSCDISECLTQNKFQAIFLTRSSLPNWFDTNKHRVIGLPPDIIERLIKKNPYYLKTALPFESPGENRYTLSVLAYLVIGNHISSKKAEVLTDAMISRIKELVSPLKTYELVDLKEFISKFPVKRHPGVEDALISHDLIVDPRSILWLLLLAPALIFLLVWSHKHSVAYDMLGCRIRRKNMIGWSLKQVNQFYMHIIIILAGLALISSALWLVRHFEEEYTIENNVSSSLSDISFSEALIWMFVFTGTGHTDDKFPKSVPGKLLVTSFPFVGYTSLIGLIWASYYSRRRKRIEMDRGTLIVSLKNHVLICGWNEKAAGIVYGLTCKDAPVKRKVVVVAELGSDAPLASYNFDHRYVFYCNGDSANTDVLSRAHASDASEAIILAGSKKRATKNVRSVLTALALKRNWSDSVETNRFQNFNFSLLKKFIPVLSKLEFSFPLINPKNNSAGRPEPFVITELLYRENMARFDAANSDAILDSEIFSNRLISSCCLGSGIADFVLDMLTHDEFSEIYVMPAALTSASKKKEPLLHKQFIKRQGYSWVGWKLMALRNKLMSQGVNLIGVNHARDQGRIRPRMTGVSFNDHDDTVLVLDNPEYTVQIDDKLLFLAQDQKRFNRLESEPFKVDYKEVGATTLDKGCCKNAAIVDSFIPRKIKVLIVGDWQRCENIRDELSEIKYLRLSVLSTNVPESEVNNKLVYNFNPETQETWEKIPLDGFQRVVILAQGSSDHKKGNILEDQGDLDAPTLFVANTLRKYIQELQLKNKPEIVAEMQNFHYRGLFDNCADVVVPATIFIERLLIKGIYHHGDIGDLFSALLAENDGTYLISHCIQDEKDHFFGVTIKSLFSHASNGIQVLGHHPKLSGKSFLKNGADFKFHFAISPLDVEKNTSKVIGRKKRNLLTRHSTVGVGDIVVIIYSPGGNIH